ncbi:MAG: O-antigen ligase family protein [Victivallaceae bacterium]
MINRFFQTFCRNNRAALYFFCAALCCYPLIWTGSRYFDLVVLFGHPALTLTAMLILSFSLPELERFFRGTGGRAQTIAFFLVPATLAIMIHYYFRRGNVDIILNGLYYPVVLLLGAVHCRQFARMLPFYLGLLGLCNLAVLTRNFLDGALPVGLAGNWNWSFSLLALGLAALVFLFSRGRFFFFGAAAAVPMTLLFGNSAYFARGTMLAVAGAGLMLLARRWPKKTLLWGAVLLLTAFAVATATGYLDRTYRQDVRPYLASATLSLMAEHPLIGVGPGLFESAIAPKLPAGYHLSQFAASRHPHAHNQTLQFGVEFGFGGIILVIGMAVAGYMAAKRLGTGDELSGDERPVLFALFTFVLLLIHGQFDVLLAEWPADTVFLIAAGILWGYGAGERTVPEMPDTERSAVRWPLTAIRLLLLIGLAIVAAKSLLSGIHAREAVLAGRREDPRTIAQSWAKSLDYHQNARNCYGAAAHALFSLKDPELAGRYLDLLTDQALYENYLHNHSLRGRALAAQGKYDQALTAFEQEQRNFPESAINWALRAEVLDKLGRETEKQQARTKLREVMDRKNLPLQALPLLFKNPEWDINARHFDRKLLEPGQ